MIEIIKRFSRCFFALLLIFSAGMILIYLIPNSALEPQYSKSIAQIGKEDAYAQFLFDTDGAILDNFMDRLMISTCRYSDTYDNIFQAAFDNNGYPRYWNGYLLTLRPVLSQFTWQQIRYLNMFLLLTCFCLCFSGIQHQLNIGTAVGFTVSIIACFLVFIGESLQYFSVFMILFAILLAILYLPRYRNPLNAALLLFASGMLTNFFDMLTAPLLTLGIPLILILCLNESPLKTFRNHLYTIINLSVSWGLGYALSWVSKWAIGTLVLKQNIFADAMKTAEFRVNGSESYPLDRGLMYKLNFETYFFAKGHKPAIFLALILLILAVLLLRHHKKNWKGIFFALLLVGLFPYIWFTVFANHSQLHYFYTYRIQAITLFAIFAALCSAIDWKQTLFSRKVQI